MAGDRRGRSLADDPGLLASIDDIERGLSGASATSSSSPPRSPRALIELFPPTPVRAESTSAAGRPAPKARPAVAPSPALPPAADPAPYLQFYRFHERPFSPSSDPKFFYHSTGHNRAAQAILGAVGRRERFVLLTGASGLGKTILCRTIIEELDHRTLTSMRLAPVASFDDLVRNVLVDFGVISRDELAHGRLAIASRAELLAVLREFLASLAALQAFALVILDDAQNLPDDVLEQLTVLAETDGDERLLQIVLVGEPRLLDRLGRPHLRPLSRRIALPCALRPLAREELGGYIRHRLTVSSDRPAVEFDDDAIALLHARTGGVPHAVNLLCERALEAGAIAKASAIGGVLMRAAADDLDLEPPAKAPTRLWLAAVAAAMLLMMLAGAAGAAYVFRGTVAALVSEWKTAR